LLIDYPARTIALMLTALAHDISKHGERETGHQCQ
jgi:hypothetical protein